MIVITGALGHIGSRLIRELADCDRNEQVVMIDNLATQRYATLFGLPGQGRYRFIEGDVLTLDLAPLFEGARVVVHLAAITDASSSFERADDIVRVNFGGAKRVADACAATGSPLFYVSTTSVYGMQDGRVDEACEPTDLHPQSPYAESKLREEGYLRELGEKTALPYTIARFGTIFGVSRGMRFHTAVNKFCWQAVMGQPLTVWSTAYDQMRPYLDLGDAVRAIVFGIRKDLFDRQVYNVLTVNATVCNIVDVIRRRISDVRVEFVDSPIMNQLSYEVSNERFLATGFRFQGSLEAGIGETLELLAQANGRMASATAHKLERA